MVDLSRLEAAERLARQTLNPDNHESERACQLARHFLEAARELRASLAREQKLREALEHYAEELHWSIELGEDEGEPDCWGYDGGESLPWTIARGALSRGGEGQQEATEPRNPAG